jgi:hypothetical protein
VYSMVTSFSGIPGLLCMHRVEYEPGELFGLINQDFILKLQYILILDSEWDFQINLLSSRQLRNLAVLVGKQTSRVLQNLDI